MGQNAMVPYPAQGQKAGPGFRAPATPLGSQPSKTNPAPGNPPAAVPPGQAAGLAPLRPPAPGAPPTAAGASFPQVQGWQSAGNAPFRPNGQPGVSSAPGEQGMPAIHHPMAQHFAGRSRPPMIHPGTTYNVDQVNMPPPPHVPFHLMSSTTVAIVPVVKAVVEIAPLIVMAPSPSAL